MKKLFAVLVPVLMVVTGAYADSCVTPTPNYSTNVHNVNKLYSEQSQQQIMQGQGYATADEAGDMEVANSPLIAMQDSAIDAGYVPCKFSRIV